MHPRVQMCALFASTLLLACVGDRNVTAPASNIQAATTEDEEVDFAPLKGLTGAQFSQFLAGRAVFARVFVENEGLGPIFNASACAECHEDPGVGGPGDEVETHFSNHNGTSCDLLEVHGGNVLQDSTTALLNAATGFRSEPPPDVAAGPFQIGKRTTPDVLGFGLFDAIPDAAILARADPNDANGDGISGRAHIVNGRVGKFGRKAGDASLDAFNAGAFLQEMGITNPENPLELNIGGHIIGGGYIPASVDPFPESPGVTEVTQAELDALNAFVRFLAPPTKLAMSNTATTGKGVFKQIGCLNCHVENMTTGPSPIAALDRKPVHPFSDFLLHDIGTGGANDIRIRDATAGEFRTEPLTGLRFSEEEVGFLHDGSALTIEAAIQRHGGEANSSRSKFNALTPGQRNALLTYLRTI